MSFSLPGPRVSHVYTTIPIVHDSKQMARYIVAFLNCPRFICYSLQLLVLYCALASRCLQEHSICISSRQGNYIHHSILCK